jgi:pSer/pThr/pTyr-binding forkhead associated (FHA) protein
MAKLILREGGGTKEFDLDKSGSATIGRAPDCDIPISDTQASRRHCSVVRLQSGYEVSDLGSTNGTLVNSTLTKRQKLKHGDVIRIGAVELVFDDPDSAGAGAEPAVGYLVYAKGARKGERCELTGQRTTIGRKATNTLVLEDTVCSSYHCEIVRDLNGYTIRDLGSTNGTLVNGEMITEAQLAHGARIRVGNTRFVFQDPAMAEIDLELAGAEEDEEWGMMRDIDLAAVRKRNPATIVYAVLFLAIVGAGGYFVTQRPERKGDEGPQAPPGNLHEGWSFESSASRFLWTGEPAGGVLVGITSAAKGQGAQALEIRATVPDSRAYYVLTLTTDRSRYRLRGVGAVRGGVRATVGLQWLGAQGLERWTAVPLSSSGAPAAFELAVTPPSWANRVRLGARMEGTGNVILDDVSVVRDGAPAVVETKGNEFALLAQDGRWADLSHAGATILANGRVLARDAAGQDLDLPGLSLRAEAQDAEHILVTVEGGGDAARGGIVFEEVGGYLSLGGFRAFTPKAADESPPGKTFHPSFPDDGVLLLKGVRKLLLGPSGRALAALPATEDGELDAEARVDGQRRTVAFLGPMQGGSFAFRFKVDLRGETQLATQRMSDALALHSARRYGDFLAAAQQALAEFPFANKSTRDDLRQKIDQVNEMYEQDRKRVDRLVVDYKQFKDRTDLDAARVGLEQMGQLFQIEAGAGARGEHYAKTEAEITALDRTASEQRETRIAEPTFVTATLLNLPQGEVYSAAIQLYYIVRFLPASTFAPQAEAELKKIERSHPNILPVLRRLLG